MANNKLNRRTVIKGAAAGAGFVAAANLGNVAAANCGCNAKTKGKTMKLSNDDFYTNGKLDADKAKKAYYDMFKKFNYPIYPMLKPDSKDFWAIDFGLGDFVNVGMAGVFWANDYDSRYFCHEIYLLPGQMIVEHAHVKTQKAPAKMEGWMVRYGSAYNFGEGEANVAKCDVKLPESQKKFITCPHVELLKLGDIRHLKTEGAKHFLMGGPEGAIVTEFANYHDGDGLRFTNPKVKF